MLRRCALLSKYSKVRVRPVVSSKDLAYTKDYKPAQRITLGRRYDVVTPENRFSGLKLMLEDMSGHVGRRQVRLLNEMEPYAAALQREGVDWHAIKAMTPEARRHLLLDRLKMPESAYLAMQVAVEARVCGVLTRGSKSKNPGTYCKRPGVAEHGWRCGAAGHTEHVYFEGKDAALPALESLPPWLEVVSGTDDEGEPLRIGLKREAASSSSTASASGLAMTDTTAAAQRTGFGSSWLTPPSEETERLSNMALWGLNDPAGDRRPRDDQLTDDKKFDPEARKRRRMSKEVEAVERDMERSSQARRDIQALVDAPNVNFYLDGRYDFESHPRVWSSPHQPTFVLDTIGYEFYVHPLDPRSKPQVVDAANDWVMHARMVQNTLWERVEEHGLAQKPQPLSTAPGDVPNINAEVRRLASVFTTVDPETGVSVEQQLYSTPAGLRAISGRSDEDAATASKAAAKIPFFTPAPPPLREDGVPLDLPCAPTFAVRSMYRPYPVSRDAPIERQMQALRKPLVELSLLVHPKACAWLPPDARATLQRELLEVAARMPYALPWTLYFRLDTASRLRSDASAADARGSLLERCADAFDPALHVKRYEDRVRQFAEAAITRAAEDADSGAAAQPTDADDSALGFWDHSALGRAYLGEVLDAVAGEGGPADGEGDPMPTHDVEFESPQDASGEGPTVPLSSGGSGWK